MTEQELEIQELRQEIAKLKKENTELTRKCRGLIAKNDKLSEKLQGALADSVRYRRQAEAVADAKA